ncbi:alpha/beta hydrolase [Actinomadura rudentiformis]|uniref:Alpha/beta hydrolase n=1 Tax=Actinomadura rudentiformis TaxID=359158 RepID=A0A6H9Z2V6_9ACTN|nr:alpha/beta hydrolase [Actinomadura rudentiformis]KAB2349009.1 alpha/beta hydrolase [Actinomadura rudentiformis]
MGRDPDYLAYLRQRLATGPPADRMSLAGLRREHAADLAALPRPAVGLVKDITVDGPAGALHARLYRPARDGLSPCLVYFHGGGWVLGDVESYDPVARALTLACDVALLSVDYRRPPEHPFPAPVDDAVAAVRWTAANAPAHGLDPARLGIAGDSAGGQIAAAAAWRLRGTDLRPALQLLVYPAVDLRDVPPDLPDPDGLRFPRSGIDRILELYLRDADRTLPDVSPLLAPDLTGMPPSIVATAEHDRLRPQAEQYAARLAGAGVDVTLLTGTGLDHGFLGWGSFARRPAEGIARIGAEVRALVARI